MKNLCTILITLLLILNFSSCGATNEHLASMDQNTAKMAKELEDYKEYVKQLTESLKTMTEEMKQMAETLQALYKMSLEFTEEAKSLMKDVRPPDEANFNQAKNEPENTPQGNTHD